MPRTVTERAKLYLRTGYPPIWAVVALAAACSRGPAVTPVYDAKTHELVRLDYDYDGDGTADVHTYMSDGRPVRLEGDTNKDGVIDRWEYYDTKGQLDRLGASSRGDGVVDTWLRESGSDRQVETSTARDGAIDRREFYRNGVLVRTETDTNHDGLPDTWEEFENGTVRTILMDEDKRHGRPTRRLVYAPGVEPRVELDPDGDGQFVAASVP